MMTSYSWRVGQPSGYHSPNLFSRASKPVDFSTPDIMITLLQDTISEVLTVIEPDTYLKVSHLPGIFLLQQINLQTNCVCHTACSFLLIYRIKRNNTKTANRTGPWKEHQRSHRTPKWHSYYSSWNTHPNTKNDCSLTKLPRLICGICWKAWSASSYAHEPSYKLLTHPYIPPDIRPYVKIVSTWG